MCMMEMCSSFICPIFVLCPSTDPVCNKLAVHDRTWVLPFPELRLVGTLAGWWSLGSVTSSIFCLQSCGYCDA